MYGRTDKTWPEHTVTLKLGNGTFICIDASKRRRCTFKRFKVSFLIRRCHVQDILWAKKSIKLSKLLRILLFTYGIYGKISL